MIRPAYQADEMGLVNVKRAKLPNREPNTQNSSNKDQESWAITETNKGTKILSKSRLH